MHITKHIRCIENIIKKILDAISEENCFPDSCSGGGVYLREAILKKVPEINRRTAQNDLERTSICTREENTGLDRTGKAVQREVYPGAKERDRRSFLRQEPVHIRDTAGGKIADRKRQQQDYR